MGLKESTTVETSLSEHEPREISSHRVHHTAFLYHWPLVAHGIPGRKKKFLKSSGQETHTSDHRESFLFSKLE